MYKREREQKYIINGTGYNRACEILSGLGELVESGISKDYFWTSPEVDFIRLRENTNELTVKVSDRGTVQDRIEENVVVDDLHTAKRYTTLIHGPSVGTLEKCFSVYKVQNHVVSVYFVEGHSEIFLEIEAEDLEEVEYAAGDYKLLFEMDQVDVSLFQFYLGEDL